MVIGIDFSLATSTCRGMGRYVREIVSCLMRLDQSNIYYLYTHNPISFHLPCNFIERRVLCSNTIIAEQLYLPIVAYRDHLDVLWCPGNTFPLFLFSKTKLVVTIHDLIFYLKFDDPSSIRQKIGRLYRCLVTSYGRLRINTCITVSKYSAEEIKRRLGLQDIYITYNKIDAFYQLVQAIDRPIKREDFYFTVSGDTPSKNLTMLIDIFQRELSDEKLIIAGIPNGSILRTKQRNNIIFLPQGVGDEELIQYYLTCKMFVFLSRCEGFGIPVLEAIVCKSPIVCSNTTSLPEVVGHLGVLVNPLNKNEIIDALLNSGIEIKNDEMELHIQKFLRWSESAEIILQILTR